MLYKVLKPGIRQRSPEGGFSRPNVGDIITMSPVAAEVLTASGYVEPASTEPVKKKAKDKSWPSEAKVEAEPAEGEKA